MERIGYVNLKNLHEFEVKKEITAIQKAGIKKIIFDSNELVYLNENTELIIYSLKSLNKSIRQLTQFLNDLQKKILT